MARTDRRILNDPRFGHARGEPVVIRFEGRDLAAFDGEPVSVALHASGVDILSRSLKFHRPRGLFCAKGHCGRCLMRIDGVPNMNGCRVRCASGMSVLREPGYPSADFDVLGASDLLFRDQLDYHHMGTSSRASIRAITRLVRGVSGLGELPDLMPTPEKTIGDLHTEVLVVGGGLAGLGIGATLSEAGIGVVLVDSDKAGGRWLDAFDENSSAPRARADQLRSRIEAAGGRALSRTEAIGFFEEGFSVVRDADGLKRVHAARTVVCTGSYDRSAAFVQNDLPGVMSARATEALAVRYGVTPGERVMIWGDGLNGARTALMLIIAGVELVAMATPSDLLVASPEDIDAIRASGCAILTGHHLRAAKGRRRVSGVEFESASANRRAGTCDTLILDLPPLPAFELVAQSGARVTWDGDHGRFVPERDDAGRTTRTDVYVAGEAAGVAPRADLIEADASRVADAIVRDLRGGGRP
ncbi:MAG: (2Fe-2S)-binding protein [Deltaproteobacteria bacterium]|nr:(2Fe-2S)-binding protein [Deltaproteobacteria bacterium]